MSLTYEQIDALDCVGLNQTDWSEFEVFKPSVHDFARAIEAVATAPLLERIKELERELEAAKTMPMKYRRMEFNAQLQQENESLRAQLDGVTENYNNLLAMVYADSPQFVDAAKDKL